MRIKTHSKAITRINWLIWDLNFLFIANKLVFAVNFDNVVLSSEALLLNMHVYI